MDKTAIKNFSIWARNKLINDITYKASLLGITEQGIQAPLPQSTASVQFFDIGSKEPSSISGEEIQQRKRLVEALEKRAKQSEYKTAYHGLIEEVAYTWFNRLIAIRFMEINNYLPTGLRVLSAESKGKLEPDLVTYALEAKLDYSPHEKKLITDLKQENKLDELFRLLFIKQCNALNENLPMLFEETDGFKELLLNISFTDKEGIIYRLVHDIPEDDFNVEKEGQVEIIGWLYQYYNTEPKQAVFDGLKKNVKITKEKIPAATQLFTPDWIVRYMVENSLGRLWLENRTNSTYLKENWKYYLDEAEQTPEVTEKLKKLRAENKIESPEDIRFIDPCMGSGHILVYAFDVLMQIYQSEGYAPRDAAKLITTKNLHGLDIDQRAYQLAYFAIMMKGRSHDRRFLEAGIEPQVYHPLGYPDGEEFGSLLKIDKLPPRPGKENKNLFTESFETELNTWNFQRLLAQKYDVVVTNPPYMGSSGMGPKLSDFVKKSYPDSKSDLFAVFIEQCGKLLKPNGYQAMITQHAWMFLSSFEKLRSKLLKLELINMAHLGPRAFDDIGGEVVQTTTFVMAPQNTSGYLGTYVRLMDYPGQDEKEKRFLGGNDRYTANANDFSKIPGSPVAYWVNKKIFAVFGNDYIYSISKTPSQNVTGNNTRFVRMHWELVAQVVNKKDKWIFYAKGGGYRKWYGNLDNIVNWTPEARRIYQFGDGHRASQIINKEYWYHKGITWGLITSNLPSFRLMPEGATFDKGGSTIIVKNDLFNFTLGLLNSKIFLTIVRALNPTLNFQIRDICNMPLIKKNKNTVDPLVERNMNLARSDWDSFETSWDFTVHPMVGLGCERVEEAFLEYQNVVNGRFLQLKANEEELNRIFIEIYGLEDELTPEVLDKDVTVARIYDQREDIPESMKGNNYVLTKADVVKSLLSYAVGCMFGRYSLDLEGLAYAGGDWDEAKYTSFKPIKDNILPITDEEYFADDIVGRFVTFVRQVYGEKNLEENLDFIASALGGRGTGSRAIIRDYFVKDFYKDHLKTYKKRPIYWLFDSGKQNGFKALIYLHRHDENTIGNLRIDYLHRLQQIYENEIEHMTEIVENGSSAREIANAQKRKEKLIKQLKEAREYDAKIAHLALARISLDLDDGVKVNYEKIQTDRSGKQHTVLAKI